MAYPKGQARPQGAGRKKGTPNKKTQLLKPILDDMGYDPVKKLIETLSMMDDLKTIAQIQMKLIEMCYAKPSSISINVDSIEDLPVRMFAFPNPKEEQD